ncbi:MAG TPA: hypothetical protein VHZ95_05940, partial [Polyangiales bacterium]|nr:hypothetical protein [Polyangiales bacterium]
SRFGEQMLRYAGAQHQTEPEAIGLNGATFYLSTGTADAKVSALLDHFQRECAHKNGRLAEQWATIAARRHEKLEAHSSLWDGVFRAGGDDSGVVACVETSDTTLGPDAILERVRAVLASGELSKLGDLRYVYAVRDGRRTMFVALWSEGPLNYRAMFPRDGDAPGHDPFGLPRPPGVRRVLSSEPSGARATLNVYEASEQPAKKLIEFYAAQLPAAGFELLTEPRHFIAARDRSRLITISFQDDRHGHGIATIATQPD